MRNFILAAAAGFAMTGAAFAEHHEAAEDAGAPEPAMMEPVAQTGDCKLFAESPAMPDPKAASVEDRAATIEKIKAYQAALNEYRTCLTAVSENEDLEVDVRQAALDEFNRTVELETDMVKDWQKFSKKYDKANK